MKANKDPHPPLRGTFSRHREKALTLKSRRVAHRQSPRPRERERVAGGRVRGSAFDSMKSNKDPHPPLRGTFSRHREKALTLKSRRDAHRQSPRPRERERVAGGRVRVSAFDSMKANKDPHPPLRGTFSRHREKALTMKSRRDAHRQSPRPRERERVAGGRVR